MKTHSFAPELCLALVIAALAAGSCLSSMAQTTPAADKSAPPPVKAENSNYDLEIVDSQVMHKGHKMPATLANVVEVLRGRYPEANIVLSPGLGSITVADLKLRASRLSEELEALRIATGDKFVVRSPDAPAGGVDPATGLPLPGPNVSTGLFVLQAVRMPQDERLVEAFNVGPYLQWVREHPAEGAPKDQNPEEAVLNQIKKMLLETTARFNERSEKDNQITDFQYYKEANLFVVIGNREAVDIARKIINVLPGMSGIDDSVASHYGLAPASPAKGMGGPAADAFRRRYGLDPAPNPLTGGAVPGQPAPSKK